jgi:hypothetical protein
MPVGSASLSLQALLSLRLAGGAWLGSDSDSGLQLTVTMLWLSLTLLYGSGAFKKLEPEPGHQRKPRFHSSTASQALYCHGNSQGAPASLTKRPTKSLTCGAHWRPGSGRSESRAG